MLKVDQMTRNSSTGLTKDDLFQAFKKIEIAYAARLEERGEPRYLFDHCNKVLREFEDKFPSASLKEIDTLQNDFLRRHR